MTNGTRSTIDGATIEQVKSQYRSTRPFSS